MNETGYSSNFKTKVSRSLTDLQNSLDEACRLGLPPNLGVQLNDVNDEYFTEARGFNFKNDLTYKSASYNLEKFISSHEEQFKFDYPDRDANFNEQKNNSSRIGNRKTYLDTLRMLATHKPGIPRSVSYDGLFAVRPGYNELFGRATEPAKSKQQSPARTVMTGQDHVPINMVDGGHLECEMEQFKSQLAEMCGEVERLKHRSRESGPRRRQQSDTETSVSLGRPISEFQGSDEPCDELRRRLNRCKTRETELVQQLGEAIRTIEQAKLEEMQSVMKAEQLKEECENMKIRFTKMVDETRNKLEEQANSNEKQILELTHQLREELRVTKAELAEKHGKCLALEEQLRCTKNELDRLNEKIELSQIDKCSSNDDMHTALTQALLRRNEVISAHGRLQAMLDRERANHAQEVSIWQEQVADLQKRLQVSENAQLNFGNDKIRIIDENTELKSQLQRFAQLKRSDEKRVQDEHESLLLQKDSRIGKLQAELQRKQAYFESVMTEAQQTMHSQIQLIGKLKRELGVNVQDMDSFADWHRDELSGVLHKLDNCTDELHALRDQNRDLQTTLDDYCGSMEDMRASLQSLQSARDHQDQEIIGHLESRNKLMRLVELLTVQLQDLHRRVPDCTCGAFDPSDITSSKAIHDIFDGLLI